MPNKITLNIDKAIYTEGDYVKIKLDYDTLTPKVAMHLVVLDPSEKEVFSDDQYINSQKGSYSNVLRFVLVPPIGLGDVGYGFREDLDLTNHARPLSRFLTSSQGLPDCGLSW